MNSGVILYGAPGTGKDAITSELTQLSPPYQHFRRIKIGTGRQGEYRTISDSQLEAMRAQPGEIIWENPQYGGIYIVDRAELERLESNNVIPVLHLGQQKAVNTLLTARSDTHWLVIELTCPRATAIQRINDRDTGDTEQRIAVLDSTPSLRSADLRLDTALPTPAESAKHIDQARHARSETVSGRAYTITEPEHGRIGP